MKTWFLPQLMTKISQVLGSDYSITTELPDSQSAWLAVPVFAAAKQSGRPVPELASEIAERLRIIENLDVAVTGGFVNLTPRDVSRVLIESNDPAYPTADVGKGKTIVIDYSQPNIAKRMSIAHLRSTIIGDALRALYETLGYTVVGINYLGDWGTQYGKLVVAYQQKYGDLKPRESVTIQELFELYVGYHAEAEADDALAEQARAMFKRLEDGDPAVTKLWEFFVDISLAEFQTIYDRLHVSFTQPRMGESAHRDSFAAVTQLVRSQGVTKESDGAVIIELPEFKTPLMLRKSDGATTYATRDLAALKYRVDTYQPEAILYVVSNEQTLHFQQVFAVARMVGIAPATVRTQHVKFGFVRLAEGKMSTRQGRIIFLEDVLNEAIKRARLVVEEKNPDLTNTEKTKIAEVVGIGALKYVDLAHDRNHDILFDWDRMLQLAGDSGPYLQYTYARARSILRKADVSIPSRVNLKLARETSELTDTNEIQAYTKVIKQLAYFPLIIGRSASENAPHILAGYLNNLATDFNAFYVKNPVLNVPSEEIKNRRLMLVSATAQVLHRGLDILGIETPERL